MRLERSEAVKLILATDGKIFGVKFRKRSNGEVRDGRFRLGYTVSKGTKGGSLGYNPTKHDLIPTYRMAGDLSDSEGERRMIPIEGILEITVGGNHYEVH